MPARGRSLTPRTGPFFHASLLTDDPELSLSRGRAKATWRLPRILAIPFSRTRRSRADCTAVYSLCFPRDTNWRRNAASREDRPSCDPVAYDRAPAVHQYRETTANWSLGRKYWAAAYGNLSALFDPSAPNTESFLTWFLDRLRSECIVLRFR